MRRRLWAVGGGILIVVVALAVGISLGPGTPAASPGQSPAVLYRSEREVLPAGKYIVDQLFERPITLELPADWTGLEHERGAALIVRTKDGQPFGEVGPVVLLGIYAVDRVYRDPCRDRDPDAGAPPTLVGILGGLTHAAGFEAGPIEDTTVGGRPAKMFDLRNSIDGDDCRTHPFSQWTFRAVNGVQKGNGTTSGGTHERLWLVDVDGTVILINADSGDDSHADEVEELYEIVDSIRFE